MKESKTNQNGVKCVAAGTGPMYCGPGVKVTFLVTGEQSGGACFIFEAVTPPGGGPPPHIHHFEDESFYILQGSVTVQAGEQTLRVSPGDFIHIPRGTVHSFQNDGNIDAKAVIVISPAGPTGMQQFFEEAFYPTTDRSASPPPITKELVRRMMAAAARNGMELVKPA